MAHGLRALGCSMKIAIQGCGHGDLNAIYAALNKLEAKNGDKADLLIVCGDFQAIRDQKDLQTMACPPKYRRMGDFYEYYTGKRKAPILTLFIGGNHEASNHLSELYHGGWVAPNMYFLGYSGVVQYGGNRIASVSGIYHPRDYETGYHELPPLNDSSIRSIYHTRQFDVRKLSMLREPIDVFISHEWPHKIYEFGDLRGLLRCKPFFRQDIEEGSGIGAPPLRHLLEQLKPRRWYAAHMHVEFEARVPHSDGSCTEFLALDKCLPRRRHLRMIELPTKGPLELRYDPEWLTIVRAMNPHMSFSPYSASLPIEDTNSSEHREFISTLAERDLVIPKKHMNATNLPGRRTTFLQTAEFCKFLQIKDHWNESPGSGIVARNDDRISLD